VARLQSSYAWREYTAFDQVLVYQHKGQHFHWKMFQSQTYYLLSDVACVSRVCHSLLKIKRLNSLYHVKSCKEVVKKIIYATREFGRKFSRNHIV